MIPLALWLLSFFAPSLALLGRDDWETRERETARCDCVLLALMLPTHHEDAEVNFRVRTLRTRNLKWLSREYVERVSLRRDVGAWVRLFLAPNRTVLARDYETFDHVHAEWHRADAVFAALPSHCGYEGWLRGHIVTGEYERWLEFLDYHQFRAPAPREK